MIYHYTPLSGVFLIESERQVDSRGWFSRFYCAEEFRDMGMETNFAQCSTSFNDMRGTLRGLHYQAVPYAEAKLVRCGRGAIFDVVADIRPQSPTFGKWIAAELDSANGSMFYIPEGCAHGFQTLSPNTEVDYQISTPYQAAQSRGIRWNDPGLSIDWPIANPIMSEKDRKLPILANNANGGPATGNLVNHDITDSLPPAKTGSYG
jgi:dTDP-4-dehydrorhamnose 3,5-epimerase